MLRVEGIEIKGIEFIQRGNEHQNINGNEMMTAFSGGCRSLGTPELLLPGLGTLLG